MSEFDPAALLKQIRSKTPTRPPDLPPRPEEPSSKITQLEERITALEKQLKDSIQNEQKYLKERDSALQQISTLQSALIESENKFNEKVSFLEAMLEREKSKPKEKPEKLEDRPQRTEKKPAFIPPISSQKLRLKGILDLAPLVELYKVMPDFPRPVIKINYTSVTNA